jgi:hypothetical protein
MQWRVVLELSGAVGAIRVHEGAFRQQHRA